MITYEDICSKYNDMRVACLDNKNSLANQINQLFLFIRNDLGLSGRVWKDHDGSLNTYVNILDLSKSPPTVSDAYSLNYQFNGKNPYCLFGIEIILEQAKNAYPKTQYHIKLNAKLNEGNVIMSIEKNGEYNEFIIDTTSNQKFVEIARFIKQTLLETFS